MSQIIRINIRGGSILEKTYRLLLIELGPPQIYMLKPYLQSDQHMILFASWEIEVKFSKTELRFENDLQYDWWPLRKMKIRKQPHTEKNTL